MIIESKDSSGKVRVNGQSVVGINRSFASAKRRVAVESVWIDPAVNVEKMSESRDWEIRAAIVRVMKRDKSKTVEGVVEAVASMIRTFVPAPRDIKRSIEFLIENEYVARSDESTGTINYLA